MRQQAARSAERDDKVVNIEDLKRYRKRRKAGRADEARRGQRQPEEREQPKNRREHRGQPTGHYGLPVLFALLALLTLAVVLGMNIFQIHDVEVNGNETISAKDVVALSGIRLGDSIFKLDSAAVRDAIESNGLLEVEHITRVYPDKIVLDITQRIPHGAISYMGRFVIIDEKGCVLDIVDQLPAGQYPLIEGVSVKHSEKGKPVQGHDESAMEAMETVLSALQGQQALKLIAQADFRDLLNVNLLTRDGMVVELGKPTDMQTKATWLSAALPELNSAGHTKGVLYLTGGKGPVYAPSDSGDSGEGEQSDDQDRDNSDDSQGDEEDSAGDEDEA